MDQNRVSRRLPSETAAKSDPAVPENSRGDDLPAPIDRKRNYIRAVYWSLVAVMADMIISVKPVFAADDFWSKFSSIIQDIYGKLLGISTIVAVTAATVALLVRMISRNQRAVDEASSWLKRIVVTWIILNTLGFIVAYLQPLVAGGQYQAGSNP